MKGKVFVLFVFWLFSCAYCATNYYVANSGSDSNSGTSSSSPFKTLNKAKNSVQAGGTVFLDRASTWAETGVYWSTSGTSANRINIKPYGTGTNKPTVTAPGAYCGLCISGSFYTVTEILVSNVQVYGVMADTASRNNIFTGLEVTNVGNGFGLLGTANLVTGCYIHDLHMIVNTQGGNDDYGAVAVDIQGTYNEMSYNTAIRCKASSYDFVTDGGCIEFYKAASHSYVHHNWCQDNDDFWEAGAPQDQTYMITNTTITQNIFINSRSGGWHFTGTFGVGITDFKVYNNDFYQTTGSDWTMFYGIGEDTGDKTQIIFKNNIFYSTVHGILSDAYGFVRQNNIYYFTKSGASIGTLGSGEISANPLFVNAPTDFHLSASSPAINAGATVSPGSWYTTTDYYGQALTSPLEIGAAQYVGATAPPPTQPPTQKPAFNIYGDALASGYESNSWGSTINFSSTTKYSGTYAISVVLNSGGGGLKLHNTGSGLPVSGYNALSFYVRSQSGTVSLSLYLENSSSSALTSPVSLSGYGGSSIGTTYVHISIPLSVLNPSNSVPYNIVIQNTVYANAASFYIDQLQLVA